MELTIQNAIFLFITTEIVELSLYIRKPGGLLLLVVKISTSEPCHYVVSFDKWRFLKTPAFRLQWNLDLTKTLGTDHISSLNRGFVKSKTSI